MLDNFIVGHGLCLTIHMYTVLYVASSYFISISHQYWSYAVNMFEHNVGYYQFVDFEILWHTYTKLCHYFTSGGCHWKCMLVAT